MMKSTDEQYSNLSQINTLNTKYENDKEKLLYQNTELKDQIVMLEKKLSGYESLGMDFKNIHNTTIEYYEKQIFDLKEQQADLINAIADVLFEIRDHITTMETDQNCYIESIESKN